MLIKKTNRLTGKVNEMELNITEEQLCKFRDGEFVQNAFPQLNPTEREFMLTGMSAAEQKAIFG